MRFGLPTSAASAIALSLRSPDSMANFIHSQVRNCPFKVATIRSAASLRAISSETRSRAVLVLPSPIALASWRLLWLVAATKASTAEPSIAAFA